MTPLLNQQSYSAIFGLHKNGSDWIGSATHGGQLVSFDIDKSGKIRTK